jgi:hypothetical protein
MSSPGEEKLIAYLFKERQYQKIARPVRKSDDVAAVQLTVSVSKIFEVVGKTHNSCIGLRPTEDVPTIHLTQRCVRYCYTFQTVESPSSERDNKTC